VSQEKDESITVDLKQLEPSRPDRHQFYVFGIHVVISIAISYLNFNGDWIQWWMGIGFFIPVLLSLSALFYSALKGSKWYQDEFLPHVGRILMQPEFENDRFLSYNRSRKIAYLFSGYFATLVSQFTWTLAVILLSPFITTPLGELLFVIFIMIFVLYLTAWVIFTDISDRILGVLYSDISHLIEIDRRTHQPEQEDYTPNEYKW
jgi:hypothetical protein